MRFRLRQKPGAPVSHREEQWRVGMLSLRRAIWRCVIRLCADFLEWAGKSDAERSNKLPEAAGTRQYIAAMLISWQRKAGRPTVTQRKNVPGACPPLRPDWPRRNCPSSVFDADGVARRYPDGTQDKSQELEVGIAITAPAFPRVAGPAIATQFKSGYRTAPKRQGSQGPGDRFRITCAVSFLEHSRLTPAPPGPWIPSHLHFGKAKKIYDFDLCHALSARP